MNMYFQIKNPQIYLMIVSDSFIFALAIVTAYLFRFDFSFNQINIYQIITVLIWIVPLKLVVFLSS